LAPYIIFPVSLVAFLCFEMVQVVRGQVHLSGIARAALELLILSPVIVLLVVATGKISERLGLNDLEATGLSQMGERHDTRLDRGSLDHYRAKIKPPRRLGSVRGKFTVPKDFNDPLPKEIEGEFYK
jgi:hypothetical protein